MISAATRIAGRVSERKWDMSLSLSLSLSLRLSLSHAYGSKSRAEVATKQRHYHKLLHWYEAFVAIRLFGFGRTHFECWHQTKQSNECRMEQLYYIYGISKYLWSKFSLQHMLANTKQCMRFQAVLLEGCEKAGPPSVRWLALDLFAYNYGKYYTGIIKLDLQTAAERGSNVFFAQSLIRFRIRLSTRDYPKVGQRNLDIRDECY